MRITRRPRDRLQSAAAVDAKLEPEPSGLARRQQFLDPSIIASEKETTMVTRRPFTTRLTTLGSNRTRLRTSALALITALTMATGAGGALLGGIIQEAEAATQPAPPPNMTDGECVNNGPYTGFVLYSVDVPASYCVIYLGVDADPYA